MNHVLNNCREGINIESKKYKTIKFANDQALLTENREVIKEILNCYNKSNNRNIWHENKLQ